ncbi:MAG TPA: zinc ribbon domain-containing protein [Candidatus Binatia bacterium]|nr:zinc ribbon domain-containing protein [Candidatus Binatia bacterium]
MPIYEYRCEKCGDFEQTQRISDPPLDRCPTCRRKVRRLISNTSFQLKGSGWYVTDYARAGKNGGKDGAKDSAKDSSASSDTSSSTSDTKTETKSGSKTESKTESKSAAT